MPHRPTISPVDTFSGGRFFTFNLGPRLCGLPLKAVVEVLPLVEVLDDIRTDCAVCDLLVHRGRLVPLLDLRSQPMAVSNPADRQCRVLIVDIGGIQTGITIDAVGEVLDIASDQIHWSPELRETPIAGIAGLATVGTEPIVLLSLHQLLHAATEDRPRPGRDLSSHN